MHNYKIPRILYNLFLYCRCIVTYLESLGAKIVIPGRFSIPKIETLDFLLKEYKNPLGFKIFCIKNSFKMFKIRFNTFRANLGENEA